MMKFSRLVSWMSMSLALVYPSTMAQIPSSPLEVIIEDHGKPISPDLFGIFFEDLSNAADGGLYAELIQNRSFEYTGADHSGWGSLTGWSLNVGNDPNASIKVESTEPLNTHNPEYSVITTHKSGAGVSLRNSGFDGIVVKAGQRYKVSLFARQVSGHTAPLIVRIEGKSGEVLGSVTLSKPGLNWQKFAATIAVEKSDTDASLAILDNSMGSVALDVVSLFPVHTFHDRPNGLRADLAESVAALKPKFIRFPGGCLVHGDGLANMYRWKETIGPIEERAEQPNIWRYHQSLGLGYFEYFQFAEDIGATPVPVVAAGVSCQNSGASVTGKWGLGQQALPLPEMPAYVQDVLDLIEFANGPVTSTWGAKRAAAGHAEPFHLRYIGVGNEDAQTDAFRERFKMIYHAVTAKYPGVTVIGTVGPDPSGEDYDSGWKFANQQHLAMVDEHSYKTPDWFLQNLNRYDSYSRNGSHVYLGEYAAFDSDRHSTLRSALAEAAYMTGLERNGDVVEMSSYAPLFSKIGHSGWEPDLIHFTNTQVSLSINYYVQQMFSANSGDTYLDFKASDQLEKNGFALSIVKDETTGDLILKLVNYSDSARQIGFTLSESYKDFGTASETVLSGDPNVVNDYDSASRVAPMNSAVPVERHLNYTAPADSLTVFRFRR
jgi:alpha-N-arabinofuranosidase